MSLTRDNLRLCKFVPDEFVTPLPPLSIGYSNISQRVIEKSLKALRPILLADDSVTLAINVGKYEINEPLLLDNLLVVLAHNNISPLQIKIGITERSGEYYKK